MKIFSNLYEFFITQHEVEKIVAFVGAGLYSILQMFLMPLIGNQYFISVLTLILMDTVLGTYLAILKKEFKFKSILMPIAKLLKYAIYVKVAIILTSAPLKVVAVPIIAGLYTYIMLREGTSVLKNTSKVFNDAGMGELSNKAEDTLEDMLRKNNDKNQ